MADDACIGEGLCSTAHMENSCQSITPLNPVMESFYSLITITALF